LERKKTNSCLAPRGGIGKVDTGGLAKAFTGEMERAEVQLVGEHIGANR